LSTLTHLSDGKLAGHASYIAQRLHQNGSDGLDAARLKHLIENVKMENIAGERRNGPLR
jgi:hypothetical protein